MKELDMRFRQVHLDFHTSGYIDGIGKEFDGEEFASVLKEAGVNSVTCFARCHHGYLYYNSSHNPERVHPNLMNKNLLLEQVDYCHQKGIRGSCLYHSAVGPIYGLAKS